MGERIPVGSRVRVICSPLKGKEGVLVLDDGVTMPYRVHFDNGTCVWFKRSDLEIIADAPAPEITLNGHRYVLAETPAPEVKREPECGEIWRVRDGRLVAIGQDHDRGSELRTVVLNSGDRGVIISKKGANADQQLKEKTLTFAYPSLAAAIEAGEKFT